MTATEQRITLEEAPTDALIEAAWQAGDLSWLLLPHQVEVYELCRAWEKRDPQKEDGQYARIFLLDIGKRWGKTSLRLLSRFEDCIRAPEVIGRPGNYRFVTAFQRDIEEITGELLNLLLETCPGELRPKWQGAYMGRAPGLYFPNGSRIAMAGLDKHPDALRGRASDGDDISEAAFVRHLRYAVKNVIYHQYQQRPWARMYLESSAPRETNSEYDTEFVADAKARGAYVHRTIDDNTALSDGEREEFIRAAGGRDDPECRREYFNERVREEGRVIVPEFKEADHVVSIPVPEFAIGLTAMDPGTSDFAGLLWGYIHYERAQLVIQRAWAKPNAGTPEIAEVVRETEQELWLASDNEYDGDELAIGAPGLRYWSTSQGGQLLANPYARTSDVGSRLLQDLAREHGIRFANMDKRAQSGGGIQSELKHAGVNSLRTGFKTGQIIVDPAASELVAQLDAGRWNERHTDYEQTDAIRKRFGHWDLIDTSVVLWRAAQRLLSRDPSPPGHVHQNPVDYSRAHERFTPPERTRTDASVVLQQLYGGGGAPQGRGIAPQGKRSGQRAGSRKARWRRR